MKIIQTFKDESFRCGFPTKESCLNYLKKSYSIHSKLCETIIYTDTDGYNYLSSKLPELNLQVIDFEYIDGRFWNLPKLQAQSIQKEPYIHVDIDATLFELPVTDKKVITEMIRSNHIMFQYHKLGLQPKVFLPCSGLIGFNDISLQKEYIKSAIDMIRNWDLHYVDFESLWTVEELLLANISDKEDWFELDKNNFEHLQGSKKK